MTVSSSHPWKSLWSEAEAIWIASEHEPAFQGYVSADYAAILKMLERLQGRVVTLLEWGSGLGIVTIMASRMGFEAYGIEAEAVLVDHARQLAGRYAPRARFAHGNFIPDDFRICPELGDETDGTITELPAGYDELDMELKDFDLVYAYPWPTEHELFRNIMRRCGRRNGLLLSYDAREGLELHRFR